MAGGNLDIVKTAAGPDNSIGCDDALVQDGPLADDHSVANSTPSGYANKIFQNYVFSYSALRTDGDTFRIVQGHPVEHETTVVLLL